MDHDSWLINGYPGINDGAMTTCDRCEAPVHNDETFEIDGIFVCESCKEEYDRKNKNEI